ncbi:MAG: hypothetical protein H3C47_11665 [Candidatus Cloacimonetes bacterium]|nr:hypothetical protein [Candidatus Cloacimonadota bacterium]
MQLHQISTIHSDHNIIFIHGLGGHYKNTWSSKDSEGLLEWLAADLSNSAVWSLEYDAHQFKSSGLAETAKTCLDFLSNRLTEGRITFVTHSLGGLLCKNVLRLSTESDEKNCQKIAQACESIVFIATPHNGATIANNFDTLFKILSVDAPMLQSLRNNSDHLTELGQWFNKFVQKKNVRVQSYSEGKSIKGLLIVDRNSATCGHTIQIDDSDHITICKPTSKSQHIYESILGFLKSNIQDKPIDFVPAVKTEFIDDVLENPGVIGLASIKRKLKLGEIFFDISLDKYDADSNLVETVSFEKMIEKLDTNCSNKVVISGASQSGKSTLCKVAFRKLVSRGFVPIYIRDDNKILEGRIVNRIQKAFREQYDSNNDLNSIKDKLFIIIDDFHLASRKDSVLSELSGYNNVFLISDDIYEANALSEGIVSDFTHYQTRELLPSQRAKLIRRWLELDQNYCPENDNFKEWDKKVLEVDAILGRALGSGIVPAYPFFILMITRVTVSQGNSDRQITSQGYCYQALIYCLLRESGVDDSNFSVYFNFLEEFAYACKDSKSLNLNDLDDFYQQYSDRHYVFPWSELKKVLFSTNILHEDECGKVKFKYVYMFYYFVASSYSRGIQKKDKKKLQEVEEIAENVHIQDNAYIAVFIAHHSDDYKFFESIVLGAMQLFEDVQPATFSKGELDHIDARSLTLADEVSKSININKSPERAREVELEHKDQFEDKHRNNPDSDIDVIGHIDLMLRKTLKYMEVLGSILRNRTGALTKEQIDEGMQAVVELNFRLLSFVINELMNEQSEEEFVEHIVTVLEKRGKTNVSRHSVVRFITRLNVLIIYGIVTKGVIDIGAPGLLKQSVQGVCQKMDTPLSKLFLQLSNMWHENWLDQPKLLALFQDKENGSAVTRIIILNHLKRYLDRKHINYKVKQQIAAHFGIQ